MLKLCCLLPLLCLSTNSVAQTFTGSGGAITDDGQANTFIIPASGLTQTHLDSAYGLVSVCLNLTHTWDSDLDVQLVAPDGQAVSLFSGLGGDGDNFTNTCFRDNATVNITAGSAPFTGTFSPVDGLANVNNNQNGNGNWVLRIQDLYPAADAGSLISWSITFGPHAGMPLVIDSTRLPIVAIHTSGQSIVDEPKITAQLKIIDNGPGLQNHPTDAPNGYNGAIGIEIRGSYSASLPQKPFGFETRDAAGENLDVSLLSMPPENDWILLSTYNDKTFLRNSLAYNIFRQMGRYAPRSRFCEVLINNNYKGIYLLMEKIKRDSKRLTIAKLDTNENTGDNATGGYIIKIDYHDATNSWLSSFSPLNHTNYDVYYVYEYPDAETITPAQKEYIQGFMYSLEEALYGPDFKDPVLGYRAFLHVPSFVDYLLVNELARNNDGFKKSYYFHKDKTSTDGRLHSGPVWDFDWAWKNINECSIFAATNGSGWAYNVNDCNPDNKSPGWMKRLIQDTTFTNELKCRYTQLRATVLDTSSIFHYVDSVHALMQDAQSRHYRKWPILGINVGTPEVGAQPTSYDGEIAKFKKWVRLRIKWLDANMPGHCLATESGQEATAPLFRAFPNPAGRQLFLEAAEEIHTAELFDLWGKLCLHTEQNTFRARLDLHSIPPGVYSLKCRLGNGRAVYRKVVRE